MITKKSKISALGGNERGSALLIALMTMGVIVAVVITLAQIMLSEFKTSGDIRRSIVAYYAAEAGVEEELLAWKLLSQDARMTYRHYPGRQNLQISRGSSQTNFAEYEASADYMRYDIEGSLRQDEAHQFDFTDVRDQDNNSVSPRSTQMVLYWESQTGSADPSFEASTFSGGVAGNVLPPEDQQVWKEVFQPTGSTPAPSDRTDTNGKVWAHQHLISNPASRFPSTEFFKLRIKPMETLNAAELANVNYRLEVFNGAPTNDPKDLLYVGGNNTTISSRGTFRKSNRKIEVQVDRGAAIKGWFDFVLFSDESLEK